MKYAFPEFLSVPKMLFKTLALAVPIFAVAEDTFEDELLAQLQAFKALRLKTGAAAAAKAAKAEALEKRAEAYKSAHAAAETALGTLKEIELKWGGQVSNFSTNMTNSSGILETRLAKLRNGSSQD